MPVTRGEDFAVWKNVSCYCCCAHLLHLFAARRTLLSSRIPILCRELMALSADSVFFLFTLVDTAALLFLAIYAVSCVPAILMTHNVHETADHFVRLGL